MASRKDSKTLPPRHRGSGTPSRARTPSQRARTTGTPVARRERSSSAPEARLRGSPAAAPPLRSELDPSSEGRHSSRKSRPPSPAAPHREDEAALVAWANTQAPTFPLSRATDIASGVVPCLILAKDPLGIVRTAWIDTEASEESERMHNWKLAWSVVQAFDTRGRHLAVRMSDGQSFDLEALVAGEKSASMAFLMWAKARHGRWPSEEQQQEDGEGDEGGAGAARRTPSYTTGSVDSNGFVHPTSPTYRPDPRRAASHSKLYVAGRGGTFEASLQALEAGVASLGALGATWQALREAGEGRVI